MFVVVGVLLVVFFALVSNAVVSLIPQFERIFSDMLGDVPLPQMTQMVLRLPYFFNGLGRFLLTAILPIGAIVFLLLNREKPIAWGITISVIVFLMILIIVIPTAMLMPMMTIITEMDSGV
ncbi:MAG: hypothetical protein ACKVJU_07450 [Verrucomicrobiales bacterium]